MADRVEVSLSEHDIKALTARADAASYPGRTVAVRSEVLRELCLMATYSLVLDKALREHRDRLNDHGHAYQELVDEVNEVIGE